MSSAPGGILQRWCNDKTLISLMVIVTLLMAGMAIVGGVRHYSPVPFWDMWDGYLNFFLDVKQGNFAAWWAQQNEHRIVLAHMLFWLDLAWFGGASWFLIVVNYVLVAASAMLFYRMLRERAGTDRSATAVVVLGLLMTAWLFSWMQQENLTWAFQCQFVLAQLLPLCAFYCFHKSISSAHTGLYFLQASVLGVASAGTMANGVLVLPLLVLFSFLTRQKPLRVLFVAVLTGLTLYLYFHNYQAPANPGSLGRALKEDPLGLLSYVLCYLGSPFFYLAGAHSHASKIAMLAGAAFTTGAIHCAWRASREPTDTLAFALLLFVLYLGGTALGTAGGRMFLGSASAFSSRYTTPALMAWAAILLLYAPGIIRTTQNKGRRLAVPATVLSIALLGVQSQAIRSWSTEAYQRKLGGLALAMGVNDPVQINHVYPFTSHALAIADKAAAQKLTIFGLAPWSTAHQALGTSMPAASLPPCLGHLDGVDAVIGEQRFVRVHGWLFDPSSKTTPDALRFVNARGTVAGFAMTGEERRDVAQAVGRDARRAGFLGYFQASQLGQVVVVESEGRACHLAVHMPELWYSLSPVTLPLAASATAVNGVLPDNQWLGTDYDKTEVDGLHVYGSLIRSDADTGSISLLLRRGARLLYRSGPTGGGQILEIGGKVQLLPVSPEWTLLELSSPSLPDGEFVAKFVDSGTGWGEWSAIAVQDKNR
jgi:hypothetical protein